MAQTALNTSDLSDEEIPQASQTKTLTLTQNDLSSIVDMLSDKFQSEILPNLSKSNDTSLSTDNSQRSVHSTDNDTDNLTIDLNVNNSGQKKLSNEANSAHDKAKRLLNHLSSVNRIPETMNPGTSSVTTQIDNPEIDDTPKESLLNSLKFDKSDSFNFSGEELNSLFGHIRTACQDSTVISENRPINSAQTEPALGAFGETKQKSSLFTLNRQKNWSNARIIIFTTDH